MVEDGMVPTVPVGPRGSAEPLDCTRLGRYVVLDQLGRGGMGVVYRAYDPDLDRTVALKVLEPGPAIDDAEARIRMLREARLMARLDHPNVVRVHDVGELGNRVYVAMELISGWTLRKWLKLRPRSRKEILRVFVRAGRGLAAAHEAGLVHRDFKPDNVLVGRDDSVRVVDFGLARPVEAASEASSMSNLQHLPPEVTSAGVIVGTPGYMAPEQFMGERVDGRSDQFAFCVALWEALSGARPFRGESTGDIASAVIRGEISAAAGRAKIPAWLRRLLLQGLSVHRVHRFRSMEGLLDALERHERRRRTWAILLGVVAFVGSIVAARVVHEPCARAGEPLAGWALTRSESVEKALAQAHSDLGPSQAPLVTSTLDAWAARWRQAATRSCELAQAAGDASNRIREERKACLEGTRTHFERLVQGLLRVDRKRSLLAIDAAHALPDPARCLQSVFEGVPPLEVIEADVALALGDDSAARSFLESAGESERKHPHALMLEARLPGAQNVEEVLHRAAQEAERRRLDHTSARAWVVLAESLANSAEHGAEAEDALVLARAAIERTVADPELQAHLERAQARLARNAGEEAEHLDRVVALRERVHEAAHPAVVDALVGSADAWLRAGDTELAMSKGLRALAAAEAVYGTHHPRLSPVLEALARAFAAAGQNELAASHRRRAALLQEVGP